MARLLTSGLLLMVILTPSVLRANMAPLPRTGPALDSMPLPGHSIQPRKLDDQKALDVEMVSEQVDMKFARAKATTLTVSVTFMFKNHAATDARLPVIYPIGRRDTMTEFAVQHDGIKQKYKQMRKHPDAGPPAPGTVPGGMYYYEWDCTFPAGETMVIRIDYAMRLNATGRTGYTVSTGGPWKGKIAKSVLTLEASATDWAHIRSFGPLPGAQANEGRVVWTYTDYDPGTERDIWIEYSNETLDDTCRRLAADTESWTNRVKVCELRFVGFYSTGAVTHTPESLRKLRQALAALIDEAEQKDNRLVLPSTEKTRIYVETPTGPSLLRTVEGSRSYILKPGELFEWLPYVDLVARELVNEPETLALVQGWHNPDRAFLDQKLYAGKNELQARSRRGLNATGEKVNTWADTTGGWLAARE